MDRSIGCCVDLSLLHILQRRGIWRTGFLSVCFNQFNINQKTLLVPLAILAIISNLNRWEQAQQLPKQFRATTPIIEHPQQDNDWLTKECDARQLKRPLAQTNLEPVCVL